MVRWGRVDGVRGVTKQVLQQIFAAVLYTRALTKKQGLELAKINILAVALALLRGRPSYGLRLDLDSGASSKLTKINMVLSEALVAAARVGNVATVEQWLRAGGDANERATSGESLLHMKRMQTSATPGKFTALEDFFAQRRLRAAAKLLASPDLPDPVAHLVCKFWLGRPPRRGSGFY